MTLEVDRLTEVLFAFPFRILDVGSVGGDLGILEHRRIRATDYRKHCSREEV
jgi:hypothetical protein